MDPFDQFIASQYNVVPLTRTMYPLPGFVVLCALTIFLVTGTLFLFNERSDNDKSKKKKCSRCTKSSTDYTDNNNIEKLVLQYESEDFEKVLSKHKTV